ncbi:MAG: pilus assembly FimT family protein [Pseudomonadota bacterium]
MRTAQQGFTLIELIMVVVILGILAATAIPKFADLEDNARKGAAEGVAGSLSSAYAINYANCSMNDHTGGTGGCISTSTNCEALAGEVDGVDIGTADTDEYKITGTATTTADGDVDTTNCKVANTSGGAAVPFTFIAAGSN